MVLKIKSDIEDPRIENMSGLRINKIREGVQTAGPSPYDNKRTEVFLQGCEKARSGNPCKGCFNYATWTNEVSYTFDPILLVKYIKKVYPLRYITIGGGEPLDQIENLIILCKELKKYDYHIMIYTWRNIEDILNKKDDFSCKLLQLMRYLDIIVDGEYIEEKRIWNGSKCDGFLSSVGSGNQRIIDVKNKKIEKMEDLTSVILDYNNNLIYKK